MSTQLQPEECPEAGAIIGFALNGVDPNIGQAILGGTIANIVGHIDDSIWEKMKDNATKPCECGDPQCHSKLHQDTFRLLDALRNEWKKTVGDEPTNPDEKGLAE